MKYLMLVILFGSIHLHGQQAVDINQSIQITSEYVSDTEALFTWLPKEGATGYLIAYRTDINGPFTFSSEPPSLDTSYLLTDLNASSELVEFRVSKIGGGSATGYMMSGNNYTHPLRQKRLLILIESSIAQAIDAEMQEYISTIENELWSIDTLHITMEESVVDVKAKIQAEYQNAAIDNLLLVGHIPVPYSGNNAIDGHTSGNNHRGAWPCDAYYGDLDGNWTDTQVDNTEATREVNQNIPGDGKFDQNVIPSTMEIAVGRIDFSRLTAFSDSEVDLTKKYLLKNIAYRTGQFTSTRRGLIDNNFGLAEGFGQGAIKSFSGYFPLDSIDYGTYADLGSKDYLWSYGAGAGSYTSASGIINTNQLAADSIQSVFTNLFGSYFGDWDINNNLLRASLASGTTLINAWSGRPVWYFHTMAMGNTVGEVVTMTQNNIGNYASTFGNRLTHIALMGDPTLKMYYTSPVQNIDAGVSPDLVTIAWDPPVAAVDGYFVYEKNSLGEISRLTDFPITENSLDIDCPTPGKTTYIVRPIVLESSPSGSYFNEGPGQQIDVENIPSSINSSFSYELEDSQTVSFTNESEGAISFFWDFDDETFSEEENPTHTFLESGTYSVSLVAVGPCQTDTIIQDVQIILSSVSEEYSYVKISPNPAANFIRLTGLKGNTKFTLRNSLGMLLKNEMITNEEQNIDISHLPVGIYFIQLDDSFTVKLIKD